MERVDYTFGKYLKKIRLEKEVSVEDICSQTKISKHMIGEIEKDNLDKLPEAVIMKGFLKAYSAVLNIDPVIVLDMYAKATAASDRSADLLFENDIVIRNTQGSRRTMWWVIAGTVTIGLLIGLAIFLVHMTDRKTLTSTVQTPAETVSQYTLDIECVDDTTLKIGVDDKKPDTYYLKPKDSLSFKASDTFHIWLDNNCGVTFFIDDQKVDNKGQCGEEISMILPGE